MTPHFTPHTKMSLLILKPTTLIGSCGLGWEWQRGLLGGRTKLLQGGKLRSYPFPPQLWWRNSHHHSKAFFPLFPKSVGSGSTYISIDEVNDVKVDWLARLLPVRRSRVQLWRKVWLSWFRFFVLSISLFIHKHHSMWRILSYWKCY